MSEDEWPTDAAGIADLIARMDNVEPVEFTPQEEADLAVLSQDIFSIAPENLAKTHVVLTMVAGKVVYSATK